MYRGEKPLHETGLVADMLRDIARACEAKADLVPHAVAEILKHYGDDPALLTPAQCTGASDHYARHILHADPAGRFTVVAIVWGPGQQSTVHAHYTWCAYRIFSGHLEEDHYRWDAEHACARHTETVARDPGQTSFGHAGLEQIHRVRNASGEPAISIHVYGIDAARIGTHVNRPTPEFAEAALA